MGSVEGKIESKTLYDPMSGCHLWTGYTKHGYAWGGVGEGQPTFIHRYVWEQRRGKIPKELCIDHLCRVRNCLNPDHMELVTSAENTRRGLGGERARERQKSKTHCLRGHDLSNAYVGKSGKRQCRECSRMRDKSPERKIGKSHCANGHPWVAENIYTNPNTGWKRCRKCHSIKNSKEYS